MRATTVLPIGFAVAKTGIHLLSAQNLGFQRDEFLYLALGRHLDWGYWSNPPFIGAVSWTAQHLFGDTLWATRLMPALCGGLFVWLVLRMVRELGGGAWAMFGCGMALLGSLAWLRTFSMFQPVPFDVLYWTLPQFFLLRWLNTKDPHWWWALGASVGLGLLNKYTLVFFGVAFLLALLCVPERKVLLSRQPWLAAGIALALLSPNLYWQWQQGFPVLQHFQELKASQLDHVEPLNFLLDQFLFHGPAVLVWGAGLLFLLRAPTMRPYRVLGWFFVAVLGVFLAFSGKSYYTIGAYPVLFAAGAVFWAQRLRHKGAQIGFAAVLLMLQLPLLPYGLPLWSAERLAAYFQRVPIEGGLRWEDGEIHPLPQDYADMLGWPELGALVDTALIQSGNPEACLVYGENYGQAGAAAHYSALHGKSEAVSFSDSYRLWVPRQLPATCNTLIYINDELGEDVAALFADIRQIGSIEHPLAREKGSSVWLCQSPKRPFPDFWAERVGN